MHMGNKKTDLHSILKLGFTNINSDTEIREMIICGKKDYKYSKDLFFQCEK